MLLFDANLHFIHDILSIYRKPEVAQAIQSKESWRAIYSWKLKPISKNGILKLI